MECSVCLEPLITRRTTTTPCGHRFCALCLRRSVAMLGPKCPMCRAALPEEAEQDGGAVDEMSAALLQLRRSLAPRERRHRLELQVGWRRRGGSGRGAGTALFVRARGGAGGGALAGGVPVDLSAYVARARFVVQPASGGSYSREVDCAPWDVSGDVETGSFVKLELSWVAALRSAPATVHFMATAQGSGSEDLSAEFDRAAPALTAAATALRESRQERRRRLEQTKQSETDEAERGRKGELERRQGAAKARLSKLSQPSRRAALDVATGAALPLASKLTAAAAARRPAADASRLARLARPVARGGGLNPGAGEASVRPRLLSDDAPPYFYAANAFGV